MSEDVVSFLSYKLRRLAEAPPEEAALAIRELLERERNLKFSRLEGDQGQSESGQPTILHRGRGRLNVV